MYMIKLLLVGLGGFVGAVGRYLVSGLAHKIFSTEVYPVGTITVNVIGCLVLGFCAGLVQSREFLSTEFRLCVMIGLLGSFTTYSTFSYETVMLLRDGQYIAAMVNVTGHLILGLLAVAAGYAVSNAV
jgi:CrcB protein